MDGIALRRFNVGSKKFAKDEKVTFPDDQFATFESLGMVQGKVPTKNKAEEKTKSEDRPD